MHLAEELFVAEGITDFETIVYALRRRIPIPRLVCIVLFSDKNRLELLSSRELFTDKYADREGILAGIAYGRREAYDLLVFMAQEALQAGKDITRQENWVGTGEI